VTLPTDGGQLFVTDGGMETTLIFRDGLELPEFASFVLLDDEAGLKALRAYYESYAELASELGAGIVLDTPTWRASSDWGERLGYDEARLEDVNRRGSYCCRSCASGAAATRRSWSAAASAPAATAMSSARRWTRRRRSATTRRKPACSPARAWTCSAR
jgi:S-methylmethionine-dependent homocysteine/selenocysteine methylase